MKAMLSASAIALTLAIGTIPCSADAWHGGGWHHGYSHHHGRYHSRPYYAHPRYDGQHNYASGDHNGYAGGAVYNAGFNDGARAQWSIAYRRWQYEYATWRQTRGPTGIFAVFGGGFGGHYGSRDGTGCDCDQ